MEDAEQVVDAAVRVCGVDDVPDGEARRFDVGRRSLAVVRLGDDWYCIGDTCTHQKVSLSEGDLHPDTLELEISQDVWRGKAAFTVSVDGAQVGGTLRAAARQVDRQHDTLTLRGDWGEGPHVVTVDFLNDAWGGTTTTDRNLHVEAITWNGVEQPGAPVTLFSAGPVDFAFG